MFSQLIVLFSIIASVNARCDNACSGHGTCNQRSLCECYDNFGMGQDLENGDCSDRVCPFDMAFVDKPDINGEHHKYAECSGKGVCTRSTGECSCFPGYEGPACQRQSCPNSCSGHGVCVYIEDMPYGTVYADYKTGNYIFQDPATFRYDGWDKGKITGCLCDPEYGDIDCSKRLCPFGADIMDVRNRPDLNAAIQYQVQQFRLKADTTFGDNLLEGKSFAITFTSKTGERFTTIPLVVKTAGSANTDTDFHEFLEEIEEALESLPNYVINDCKVTGTVTTVDDITIEVTFTGSSVQGNQELLTIEAFECLDGCTPKITGLPLEPGSQIVSQVISSDFNTYECGRRGKCDYTSGLCNCFSGYTGPACGIITALV